MSDAPSYDIDHPEPLPATPRCANCDELRRLLSGMRHRIVEVEREYGLLMARVAESDAAASGAAPPIEIVSDVPAALKAAASVD